MIGRMSWVSSPITPSFDTTAMPFLTPSMLPLSITMVLNELERETPITLAVVVPYPVVSLKDSRSRISDFPDRPLSGHLSYP